MRRRLTLIGLAAAALFAVPAAAQAAVTIGPNPLQQGDDNIQICGQGNACTFVQTQGGSLVGVAPFNGVIVKWRTFFNSATVTLRVVRPSGASFVSAGTGSTKSTSGGFTVFTGERLPIKQGDAIALDNSSEALLFKSTGSMTDVVDWFQPPLADGAAARPPSNSTSGNPAQGNQKILQLNADIERDADGDGFGDETQDQCPTNPARHTPPCTSTTPDPTPPTPIPDKTAPSISSLSASPKTFGIGSALPKLAKKVQRSTTIAFKLSEDARVTFAFTQRANGRKNSKGKCVRGRRTGARCKVTVARGSFALQGQPSLNKVVFTGRLSSKKTLAAGTYTLTLSAKDAVGNVSKLRSTTVTLVKCRPGVCK